MKKVNLPGFFFGSLLRIAICAVFVAGAQLSLAADNARLVINRSAVLGSYVSVTVRIDGKLAGQLTRGRTFETNLTPGTHKLTASAGSGRTDWHGTLNVQAGQTYTYTASLSVNELVLTPATASR